MAKRGLDAIECEMLNQVFANSAVGASVTGNHTRLSRERTPEKAKRETMYAKEAEPGEDG